MQLLLGTAPAPGVANRRPRRVAEADIYGRRLNDERDNNSARQSRLEQVSFHKLVQPHYCALIPQSYLRSTSVVPP
jgi:hypothetical protein